MDSFIEEVVAIADAVAARRRSGKRIMLSFDEWNVWYRDPPHPGGTGQAQLAGGTADPGRDLHHALTFDGACISLLNHADRVTCACLAQLVNVIAPIMTETSGPAWRQTIFFPFAQMSRFGRDEVLRASVASPTYATSYDDPRGPIENRYPLPAMPYLKLAAVAGEAGLSLFALNRSLDQAMDLEVTAKGFSELAVEEALELRGELAAVNIKDAERISPAPLAGIEVQGERLRATLAPASWNLVRLGS
jgi:alpha-N-arabinofuranosidase